jgi:hypothetical protein
LRDHHGRPVHGPVLDLQAYRRDDPARLRRQALLERPRIGQRDRPEPGPVVQPQDDQASGLSVNVMYGIKDGEKRAVGFKLSEGMEVPGELASRFKFARQKSKLAGVIRGSFFVIKGEY